MKSKRAVFVGQSKCCRRCVSIRSLPACLKGSHGYICGSRLAQHVSSVASHAERTNTNTVDLKEKLNRCFQEMFWTDLWLMLLYIYINIIFQYVWICNICACSWYFHVFSIFQSSEAWAELLSWGVRCFVSVVLGRFTTIPGIQQ